MKFRMTKITVDQFAILTREAPAGDISINIEMNLKYSVEARRIMTSMLFTFEKGSEKALLLEQSCEFEIAKDDISLRWESNNTKIYGRIFRCADCRRRKRRPSLQNRRHPTERPYSAAHQHHSARPRRYDNKTLTPLSLTYTIRPSHTGRPYIISNSHIISQKLYTIILQNYIKGYSFA